MENIFGGLDTGIFWLNFQIKTTSKDSLGETYENTISPQPLLICADGDDVYKIFNTTKNKIICEAKKINKDFFNFFFACNFRDVSSIEVYNFKICFSSEDGKIYLEQKI